MRVRTVPIAVSLVATALAGSMALTGTTAMASSGHSSHSRNVTVVRGNCNAVNGSTVNNCTVISHSHRHGNGNGGEFFNRQHGGILEGVGDVVGGLLGAL
jgi:hypothetical protein